MSTFIIGSVAIDSVATPLNYRERIMGGSGPYASLSASYLSSNVKLYGIAGYDFPKEYIQLLKQRNIDITNLKILEEEKTFFWSGKYLEDMNSRETLVTELNALAQFNPEIEKNTPTPRVLMVGNLQPQIQEKAIDSFSQKPDWVILDTMNYWISDTPKELDSVLKKIDVLCINDEEALQLSKKNNTLDAAQYLLDSGIPFIIIKKGEYGAYLFSPQDIFYTPALPTVNIEDPTGAGDAFAGGIVGYLDNITTSKKTRRQILKAAMTYGTVMASFTIQAFGVDGLLNLKTENIEERISQLKNLTDTEL